MCIKCDVSESIHSENLTQLTSLHTQIDINAPLNDYGRTGLIIAASCGHPSVVSWYLQQRNIDVNYTDKDNNDALSEAKREGNFTCANMIENFKNGVILVESSSSDSDTFMDW